MSNHIQGEELKNFLIILLLVITTSISLSSAENLQVKPTKEKTLDTTEKPIKGNAYFSVGILSLLEPRGTIGLFGLGGRLGPFGMSGIILSMGTVRWFTIEPSLFLQLNKGFALQALVGYSLVSYGEEGSYYRDYAGTIYGFGFQIYVKKLMLGCTFRILGHTNTITNGFFMLNFGASFK